MRDKYGIISIILALIGFILTFFNRMLVFSIFGIVFAFIAIILGVLGVVKSDSHSISLFGVILGIVVFISWIIIFLLFLETFGAL